MERGSIRLRGTVPAAATDDTETDWGPGHTRGRMIALVAGPATTPCILGPERRDPLMTAGLSRAMASASIRGVRAGRRAP